MRECLVLIAFPFSNYQNSEVVVCILPYPKMFHSTRFRTVLARPRQQQQEAREIITVSEARSSKFHLSAGSGGLRLNNTHRSVGRLSHVVLNIPFLSVLLERSGGEYFSSVLLSCRVELCLLFTPLTLTLSSMICNTFSMSTRLLPLPHTAASHQILHQFLATFQSSPHSLIALYSASLFRQSLVWIPQFQRQNDR